MRLFLSSSRSSCAAGVCYLNTPLLALSSLTRFHFYMPGMPSPHTHTHTASAQPPVLECVEQAFCWAGTPAAGASRPVPLPSQTHKIKMYYIHSYCLFVQNSDPKVHHNIMPSVRCWLKLWFLMVWCVYSDNKKPQKVTLIRKFFYRFYTHTHTHTHIYIYIYIN